MMGHIFRGSIVICSRSFLLFVVWFVIIGRVVV
jgi:hypothetical protein